MACPKCGSTEWHACPGFPIPPMTPEKEAELKAALGKMFEWDKMEQQEAMEKAGVAHMADAPAHSQPHPNLPAPEAVGE